MKNLEEDKELKDGETMLLKLHQEPRETTTSSTDQSKKHHRRNHLISMPMKLNSLSMLERELLLEVPEVSEESVESSRLLMTTTTSPSIKKSSRKLCMTSELVSLMLKLDKLSESLIEMAQVRFHMMNS